MTRRILILLMLCLLPLTGCRKDVGIKVGTGSRAIRFSPDVSVDTKYNDKPDEDDILIYNGSQVSLFGVLIHDEGEPGESETTLFDNQTLSCSVTPDPLDPSTDVVRWSYTPLKYWDETNTGHYYFSAVYPHCGSDDARVGNDYFLVVKHRAGDFRDLMVARGSRYLDDPSDDGIDPVPMKFRHATAAVRFLFGKESASVDDNYTLTAFSLEGMVMSGTLKVVSQSRSNPAITASDWTQGPRGNLFSEYLTSPVDVAHPTDVLDPDDYTELGWFYMVPQSLTDASAVSFSVSYNNQEAVSTRLTLAHHTDQYSYEQNSWEPNSVYNYFITLTQSGLNLTVKTVPWDEVEVTTDVMTFEPSE